jgi:hypothetical protein
MSDELGFDPNTFAIVGPVWAVFDATALQRDESTGALRARGDPLTSGLEGGVTFLPLFTDDDSARLFLSGLENPGRFAAVALEKAGLVGLLEYALQRGIRAVSFDHDPRRKQARLFPLNNVLEAVRK